MELSYSSSYWQARQLQRDPTEDEVKTTVDVEVAEIIQKKDQKREKAKLTVDDSSDEEFLEQRLDSLVKRCHPWRQC
jgi:DNA-directed RNA polymerase specialized sigma subunit